MSNFKSFIRDCGCKSYEDCDCEAFDVNEAQAEVDAQMALEAAEKAALADTWGDKWERLYSDDASVLSFG